MGPPLPIKSNTKSHEFIIKSYSKEKNGERDTGAAAWEEQNTPRTKYKSRTNLIQVKGYLYPRRPVRPVPWTGQIGWLDRSDRCQGLGMAIPPADAGIRGFQIQQVKARIRYFTRGRTRTCVLRVRVCT